MITPAESIVHLCAAAAISTAMLGVGFGALGVTRRVNARLRWPWIAGGVAGAAMTFYVANVELRFGGNVIVAAGVGVIVGLALAAVLVRIGLRGRNVGDHPHCRVCGFDLFGRPEGVHVCGECGAALDAPRAITAGVHARRRGPLLTGVFVALLSLAVGTAAAREMTLARSTISLVRYKPTSWLIGDLSSSTARARVSARSELYRRLAAGSLAQADVQRVIQAVGSGDPTFAVTAWSLGRLDEPTMRAMLRAHATATLQLAPASSADRVPFAIRMDLLKSLNASGGRCSASVVDRADTIEGTTVPPDAIVGATSDPFSPTWIAAVDPPGPFGTCDRRAAPLPSGVARVHVKMMVDVTLNTSGRAALTERVPITLDGQTSILVGMRNPLPSTGGVDPSMNRIDAIVGRSADDAKLTITVRSFANGQPFVGELILRDARGERTLGELVLLHHVGRVDVDALPDDGFSLVLRPTPERGIEMLRPVATYQHEVVIDALRIQRLDRPSRQKR